MEDEKIDMLISEVRELRKALDALTKYLEGQLDAMSVEFEAMNEEFKRIGEFIFPKEQTTAKHTGSLGQVIKFKKRRKRRRSPKSKKL